MPRRILRGMALLLLTATFAASLMMLCHALYTQPKRPPPHGSTGLTIEQIRLMQQFVTSKLVVTDVLTTRVAGHAGAMEVVLALRGELTIGVDLSAADLIEVDDSTRNAVLTLPEPALLDARVDHGRSRIAAVRSDGLWSVLPADAAIDARMIDAAYAQAQRNLESAVIPEQRRQQAKDQAETVLKAFAARLGWKLELRWQSAPRSHGEKPWGRGRAAFALAIRAVLVDSATKLLRIAEVRRRRS